MKPVILKQHEVIHLRDNGSVIAWRAVKLQIGKGYLYSGCANAREYLGPKAFGKWGAYFGWKFIPCPYGRTREERWVRETSYGEYVTGRGWQMAYLADGDEYNNSWDRGFSWRSPILMKEAQSRFTVTLDVGVKRIHEVTEEEAIDSGVMKLRCHEFDKKHFPIWRGAFDDCVRDGLKPPVGPSPRMTFRALWESINGPGSWESNPWVWVIEFKRI